jgi:type I restriction enzyme S subunit
MGEDGVLEGWEVKPVGALVSRMQGSRVYREADVAVQGVVPVLDQSTNEVLGFHNNDADFQASADRPLILFGDHTCKQQLIIEPFSIGPNTIVFEASRPQCTTWLHHALLGMLHTQEYKRHWSQLTSKEIVTPPSDVAHQFAALLKPWTEQMLVLARTNQNLRRTRDLLLPRLMSGRVELGLSEQ